MPSGFLKSLSGVFCDVRKSVKKNKRNVTFQPIVTTIAQKFVWGKLETKLITIEWNPLEPIQHIRIVCGVNNVSEYTDWTPVITQTHK